MCYSVIMNSKRISLQVFNSQFMSKYNILHTYNITSTKFSTTNSSNKEQAKNIKGLSKSSQEWLSRQLADPYIEKAKMSNYRCRSAFKLIEIDNRFQFLSPGQCTLDCGAAPGSWTQVLTERTNSNANSPKKPIGKVVAIDRLPIYPIDGATILGNMDFTLASSQELILSALNDEKLDVVTSDMAPNATGLKSMDHENIVALAYAALRLAVQVSRLNAALLLKIWDGRDSKSLEADLARFYSQVKVVKPAASRTDSAEVFLFARGFRGLKS